MHDVKKEITFVPVYPDNYITPCDGCYAYVLPACPASDDNINIRAGLTASTLYHWYVQDDKFGKTYHDTATTNASGHIDIPVSSFPDKLFNEFSGSFTIYFKTSDEATSVVNLTFGGTTYQCVNLSFEVIDSDNLIVA